MQLKNSIQFVIVFFLLGCSVNKNLITNDNVCYFKDTLYSKKNVLDASYLKKIKLNRLFYNINEDNNELKKIMSNNKGYTLYEEDKKTQIVRWYNYDKNLRLREFYFNFKLNNYLDIGKERHFNSKGEVTKIIDYRQKGKYTLCYKQVLMLVYNWKPKDYEINHIRRDSIVNNKGTTYTWMVHVRHPVKARNEAKMYLYTIDAKTGKKLKKVETLLGTNDDL